MAQIIARMAIAFSLEGPMICRTKAILAFVKGSMTSDTTARPSDAAGIEDVTSQARRALDAFYDAVIACGRRPPFKPTIRIATEPGATRYDPASRAVILIPYEILPQPRRNAMDRFARIGTLGLTGREQYKEVFNNLLVAHELGHWLQEIAQRPLSRWHAEYEANRIMVAFWRGQPVDAQIAPPERRLENFVAQVPDAGSPTMPQDARMRIDEYFNAHLAEIESSPIAYAAFQKLMVRQAVAERPVPTFCDVVTATWPHAR